MSSAGIGGVPPKQRGEIDRRRRTAIGEASIAPLIERGWVVASSPTGTRAQFVWHVKDIGGPVEMAMALATQVVGIPQYGDWHPVLKVPVSNVRADPVKGSPTQAYVTVEYGLQVEGGGGWFDNDPSETTPAQIEIVSTVQSTTTNMHMAGSVGVVGTQILVTKIERDEDNLVEAELKQGGEVAYEQPGNMVIFRRRENVSPGLNVRGGRDRSAMYLGHTNKTVFLGDIAGTWLCTKMDGSSDDGGVSWNNTYEFQRREPTQLQIVDDDGLPVGEPIAIAGWDTVAIYRDPATGQPIKVAERDDVTIVQNYRKAEFHELRLYVP